MDKTNKRNSFQGHGANMNQAYPLDPSTMSHSSQDQSFKQESFNSDPTFTTDYTSNTQQYLDPSFANFNHSLNDSTNSQSSNTSQDFLQPQTLKFEEFGYNQNGLSPNDLSLDTSANTSFPNLDFTNQSLDPSLLDFSATQPQQLSLDPTNLLFDNMTSMQGHAPTPPHLLRPHASQSQSPSPRQTPSPQPQQMFGQPQRPRNMSESLDPSSAAFPPGYNPNDWAAGAAFRQHRRAPSDTFSEISSHSAQASPYMGNIDGFDLNATQHISPLANPQQDHPLFGDNLGFSQFNLNDQGLQTNHFSPGHSPLVSPSVSTPQQPLPDFNPHDTFAMTTHDLNAQFRNSDGYDMFPALGNENMGLAPNIGISGEADTMSPPEINIDFAPPSRQPSFRNGQHQGLGDALSPPENIMGRKRAKSETFARSPSPGIPARGRSPSLQPTINGGQLSVSPANVQLPQSRSPSPASSRGRSASASGTREHMLDLANRDRSAFGSGSTDRRQKHAATFQCHLCPKKFTRAYNLRSHLRTHTDERPFVCTVCGKAFARQHDRKRHEGLHSGEKKFVCKGSLKDNKSWGCGRKFARADALGRHFRSEAGRVCIKPLLEEEAAERQKNWLEEQQQQQLQSQQGFVAPPPIVQMPQLDPVLPAALLQMYPEFANFNWGPIDSTNDQGMDDDFNGRSSFDASSGGDWLSDNDMSDYQVQSGASQTNTSGAVAGWNSGEYLSDFEGR